MDKNIEKEIRILVKEEMMNCFKDLQSDVAETKNDIKEIKQILLGNSEYESTGIMKQLKDNTEYINTNKTLRVVENAKPAIEWYQDFTTVHNGYDKSKNDSLSELLSVVGGGGIKTLRTLIKATDNITWLYGIAVALGLVNLPQAIQVVMGWISNMS